MAALRDLALLGIALRPPTPERLARLARRISGPTLERLQRLAFRRLVRFAGKHSRYYRERFKAEGLDPGAVRTVVDLGDFHTPAADLISRTDEFICQPPIAAFESTGTTGRNKRIFFSKADWERAALFSGAGMLLAGMSPGDRALNTFTFSYWISGLSAQAGAMAAGVFCLPAGKSDAEEAFAKIAQYRLNVVLGLPSYAVRLTEIAERRGAPPGMKLMLCSGEGLAEPIRRRIEQVWRCPVVMAYGASEGGGGVALECRERTGYHLDMYNVLAEVRDPDPDGWGNLTLSWLAGRCMPLIRVPVGDIARIERGPCPCGQESQRISYIRGRIDEMFMLGGYNFYPDFICKAFEGVPGITGDFQGVVSRRGMRDLLTMTFELAGGQEAAVRAAIQGGLRSLAPDLWKCFEEGLADLVVEFAAPGTIRTGRKLRRFVDQRGD